MRVLTLIRLLTLTVIILAFMAGRLAAQSVGCVVHQPKCTYTVLGCFEVAGMVCPGSQYGYRCWSEYGSCCPEGQGTDYTRFCSTGCDGSGGGSC
jgi:hypothetical protein